MRSPDTVIAAWPPRAGPALLADRAVAAWAVDGWAAGAAGGAPGGCTGSAVVTEFLPRAYRVGYLLGDATVVDKHHRREQQRDRHALAANVKQGAAGFFAHADLRTDEGVLPHLEVTLPGLADLVTRAERVFDRGGCFVGPYPGTAHFDVWHGGLLRSRNPALTWAVRAAGSPGTRRVRGSPYRRFVPSVSTSRTCRRTRLSSA